MHIQDKHGQAALSRASEDQGRLGSVGALGVMSSADAVRSAAAVSAAAMGSAAAGPAPSGATAPVGTAGAAGAPRSAPLRVDAQRNLEHVLRAAREVFGELGYGAPMEDVARRARVGVGTVYRRFPSKDVLVRRIAEEETSRLTEQALTALGQEEKPWSALSRFLRTSVASGAGRLLPPQVLRVGVDGEEPVRRRLPGRRRLRTRWTRPAFRSSGREWARTTSASSAGAPGAPTGSTASVRTPARSNCWRSWGGWWTARGSPVSCAGT